MLKVLYFVPLFIMTIYIIIRSIKDEKETQSFEKDQKKFLINLAMNMLQKGTDFHDPNVVKVRFHSYDFSEKDKPFAEYDLITDVGIYPFETRDGRIIRHTMKQAR
ncbi:MAG: hypothetical protein IJL85_04685 [Erysipelotrichaceae bacterium]|nr:hypothetical protein [Erysipelotrichaceae bacterium]